MNKFIERFHNFLLRIWCNLLEFRLISEWLDQEITIGVRATSRFRRLAGTSLSTDPGGAITVPLFVAIAWPPPASVVRSVTIRELRPSFGSRPIQD